MLSLWRTCKDNSHSFDCFTVLKNSTCLIVQETQNISKSREVGPTQNILTALAAMTEWMQTHCRTEHSAGPMLMGIISDKTQWMSYTKPAGPAEHTPQHFQKSSPAAFWALDFPSHSIPFIQYWFLEWKGLWIGASPNVMMNPHLCKYSHLLEFSPYRYNVRQNDHFYFCVIIFL